MLVSYIRMMRARIFEAKSLTLLVLGKGCAGSFAWPESLQEPQPGTISQNFRTTSNAAEGFEGPFGKQCKWCYWIILFPEWAKLQTEKHIKNIPAHFRIISLTEVASTKHRHLPKSSCFIAVPGAFWRPPSRIQIPPWPSGWWSVAGLSAKHSDNM